MTQERETKHGPLFIPNGNKSKSLALTLLAPLGRAFEKKIGRCLLIFRTAKGVRLDSYQGPFTLAGGVTLLL